MTVRVTSKAVMVRFALERTAKGDGFLYRVWETTSNEEEFDQRPERKVEVFNTFAEAVDRQIEISKWPQAWLLGYEIERRGPATFYKETRHPQAVNVYSTQRGWRFISQGVW
jgi:hypothetical protein